MTTDRTQRVPKGGYSTNPSTVKNRKARENKSGEGLELEKAKNAENTSNTKFWKKTFQPRIQTMLATCTTPEEKTKLEKELRVQSNNVNLSIRWSKNVHYSQKTAKRNNVTGPPITDFLNKQVRVFQLNDDLLPDTAIVKQAKATVHYDAVNNSLRQTATTSTTDADGDTTMEDGDSTSLNKEIEKMHEEIKMRNQYSVTVQWRAIQRYWRDTITHATATCIAIGSQPLEVYILHMSAKRFNEWVKYVNPDAANIYLDNGSWAARRERRKVLKAMYDVSTVSYKDSIFVEDKSDLPLMPLSRFFEPNERIILSVLYQCQRQGLYRKSALKLANASDDILLPSAWGELTLASPRTRKGFPLNVYDGDSARYLLRTVLDDSDNIPAKMDIFLAMRDITKADASYVDFNEAVKKQIAVVEESDEDSDEDMDY